MKSDDYTAPEALESIQSTGGIVGYQPGAESALEEARRRAGAGKPGKGSGDIAHPPHYQAKNDPQGIYECIKVIEAWDLGFCLGNALKYISRAGRKPGEDAKRDLGKAIWYLQREMGDSRPVRSHDLADFQFNWKELAEKRVADITALEKALDNIRHHHESLRERAHSEKLELHRQLAEREEQNDKLNSEVETISRDRSIEQIRADRLQEENARLTADRDNWKKRAEELQGEAPAAEPSVKPGQVWQDGPEVCGRHEYIINEKTLGKVNGRWQNGVTYYRSDQFGPRLFWREIEDFHSDFQFVREEQ